MDYVVAGADAIAIVSTVNVVGLRFLFANRSSAVISDWRNSAAGLPFSSVDGDCAVSLGPGEMIDTSVRVVDGTCDGIVSITELPILGVGHSMFKSPGATETSFFHAAAISPI